MDKILKRSFDILISAVSLTLLGLPFAIIALAIKLFSKGPIFYRQQRIGRGEQPFCLYKFRTMHVRANGPLITVEGDPRITQVGRILRRWKLDELPQLWNVLRGDMSIIGPRPEVEQLVRYYTPEQKRLLEQTPGLAGLSQLVYPHEADVLQGCPNPEEVYRQHLMPKKLTVDLEYERNRTFWSDLLLLAEIILLSLLGKSYRIDRNFYIPFEKEPP
jgi:lipopolysaccharide/colanic/teichoic acid biosynthesis glycosyltransferase